MLNNAAPYTKRQVSVTEITSGIFSLQKPINPLKLASSFPKKDSVAFIKFSINDLNFYLKYAAFIAKIGHIALLFDCSIL
jgi:hypothetical protein